MNLFETYVDSGLTFTRKKCTQAMQQVGEAGRLVLHLPRRVPWDELMWVDHECSILID